MITRLAKHQDAASLVRLLDQMGYNLTLTQMQKRIEAFSAQHHQVWIAEKENHLIGVIAFACYELFRIPAKCCHIETLVIDQVYQGQGVGKALVALAENYARAQGASVVELITSNHRRASGAHAFYQTLGYRDQQDLDYSYFAKTI